MSTTSAAQGRAAGELGVTGREEVVEAKVVLR